MRPSEEYIENILEECMEMLEEDEEVFTEFEQEFLNSVHEQSASRFLTDKQWETLEKIYEERVCNS